MKSSYNERFSFSDPSLSACRATRHRVAKKKQVQDSSVVNITSQQVAEPDGDTNSMQDDLDSQTNYYLNPLTNAQPIASSPNLASADDKWLCDALESQTCMQHGDEQNLEVDVDETDLVDCSDFLSGAAESLVLPVDDLEFDSLSVTDDDDQYDVITEGRMPELDPIVHHHHGSWLLSQESSHSTSTADPLYEGSSLTSASSSVLLMKYAMKHNLTREALADLLELMKLHCPSPNMCPSSLYHLNKHFKDLRYEATMHYFCSSCYQETNQDKVCENQLCPKTLPETEPISSFIELPINLQIKCILERK